MIIDRWIPNFRATDSGWKVIPIMLYVFCIIVPLCLMIFMIRELIILPVIDTLCMPFNWEFSHYLRDQQERARYTTWWRDCSEGGWLLYVGPFGITRIVRSVCR